MPKIKWSTLSAVVLLRVALGFLALTALILMRIRGNVYFDMGMLILSCMLHAWATPNSNIGKAIYGIYLMMLYITTQAGGTIGLFLFATLPESMWNKLTEVLPSQVFMVFSLFYQILPLLMIYIMQQPKRTQKFDNTQQDGNGYSPKIEERD